MIISILLCHKSQKNVLQEEIKDRTSETYFSLKPVEDGTESLEMTCDRSYAWFLKFLDSCFQYVQPNLSKISLLFKVSRREQTRLILNCPNFAKWPIWKSIYLQSRRSYKHQIWTAGKHHWKGYIWYSASGGSDVIGSESCDKSLSLKLYRETPVIKFR